MCLEFALGSKSLLIGAPAVTISAPDWPKAAMEKREIPSVPPFGSVYGFRASGAAKGCFNGNHTFFRYQCASRRCAQGKSL
jgi:hypothetical protein